MLDKKRLQKMKSAKPGSTSPFLVLTKKSSMLPCVVWAEESKNGLGFEIGPNYDDFPTRSQCLIEGQSIRNFNWPILFFLISLILVSGTDYTLSFC